MLRDKYQAVEDKVKRGRHKVAWVGLLVICGIATVIVIYQSTTVALDTSDGSLQKRKTVYSTTTVFVLPPSETTTAPPTVITPPEASTTIEPSATAAMTGNMYCPDPQRPKILTLCNWVHTPVSGMVAASEVPGSDPAVSSAGGQSAANPFITMRLSLLGLWVHVRRSVEDAIPSSFNRGLLNSQEGIIESQRLNLEEMARLLVFVQNQTATTRDTSAGAAK
ncbi:uncharacterized protein PG986_009491 [Apiospora aurea]|uniref:Uncharacterized protein n=1 Tax=Apiospora aurea TaxID=335848 RepID=A0ABR1Q7W7_9PEZI